MSTQDLVIPHQLCSYCIDFVEKAENFSRSMEDSIPPSFNYLTDEDPILYQGEIYPSLRSIVRSGNNGCHLCSILTSAISETNSGVATTRSLDVEISNASKIYVMLTLHPWGTEPSWRLKLHRKRPDCNDLELSQIHKQGVVLERIKNEFLLSCRVCEHCLTLPRPDPVFKVSLFEAGSASPVSKDGSASPVSKDGSSNLRLVTSLGKDAYERNAHYRWTRYTGSDYSVQMIQNYLRRCKEDHKVCSSESEARKPTRLLHLAESSIQGDVRLVLGSQAQGQGYITLSYTWGTDNAFSLNRKNLETFFDRIDFDSLPKTFQDAVIICRQLGIAYLWIDALCIIQTDKDDWDREASGMASVYAGSTLTIAAAHAESSNSGFLHHRSPLNQHDCRVSKSDTYSILAHPRASSCDSEYSPGLCRLNTRGWVFQERLLSPRTLYFAPDGIHLECRMGILCERRPFFDGALDTHRSVFKQFSHTKSMYTAIRGLGTISSYPDACRKFRQCWSQIIEVYSQTDLTYISDKLVALAGIRSLFSGPFDLQASFGLWLPFFTTELLWRIHEKIGGNEGFQHCRKTDSVPSWSWASVSTARVLYEYFDMSEEPQVKPSIMLQIEKLPDPTAFVRINTSSPTDASKFAVRLRGMLCHSLSTNGWRDDGFHRQIYPSSIGDSGSYEFIPDAPFSDNIPLYCLLMIRLQHEVTVYRDTDFGLVLTPVDLLKNQYRRIGYFRGNANIQKRGFSEPQSGKKKFYAMPESVVEII